VARAKKALFINAASFLSWLGMGGGGAGAYEMTVFLLATDAEEASPSSLFRLSLFRLLRLLARSYISLVLCFRTPAFRIPTHTGSTPIPGAYTHYHYSA
jgi:hypothetical protein